MKPVQILFAHFAWLFLLSAATAQEKYPLTLRVKEGDRWNLDQRTDMQLNMKLTASGKTQQGEQRVREQLKATREVIAVENGQPSVVRVAFEPSCGGSITMTSQPGQDVRYPFAGKTVTIRRLPDGNISHDCAETLDEAALRVLRGLINPQTAHYPPQPVAVGEEWACDPKAVAKDMELGPNDRATLRCKLVGVKPAGGRQAAEIALHLSMSKQDPMYAFIQMQFEILGTGLLDLETGQWLQLDMDGKITSVGQQQVTSPETGQPVFVQFSSEGRSELRSRATPLMTNAPTATAAPLSRAEPPAANPLGAANEEDPFAGMFKNEKMTIEIKSADGQYRGTIQFAGQTYPLKAKRAGDGLEGTFESQGNSFKFTAALNGAQLTLTTGGVTHTLAKQANNPLAQPSPPPNPLNGGN